MASSRAHLQPIAEQRLQMHVPEREPGRLSHARSAGDDACEALAASASSTSRSRCSPSRCSCARRACSSCSGALDGERAAPAEPRDTIPAPRGDILDALGETMAQSRETVKLEVAPQDVRDLRKLRNALIRAGVHPDWAVRATDRARKWVTLPGRYVALDVASIIAMRGVHTTSIDPAVVRASPKGRAASSAAWTTNNAPVDGIELALDTLLRGTPGAATTMRDGRGRRFESPQSPRRAPVQGNTVVLTINHELQEIAERALGEAVAKMGAEGGDVVVVDPADGEVLAMASRRQDPRATASTALTEPYEPGSTLKPFIAATLLEKKRARETRRREDLRRPDGRSTAASITDDHPRGELLARGRDPLLEQHRHRAVRHAAVGARGVRGAARLRLRHADRRAISGRSVGHAARAEALVEAVGELAGDGLRDRRDAAAARGGVRRHRERRRAARAGAGEGGARAGREGRSTSTSGAWCGA